MNLPFRLSKGLDHDNLNDPFQMTNLVGNAAHAKIQRALDATLRRKLKAAGDSFQPADHYIRRWGYAVDATGTVPYTP